MRTITTTVYTYNELSDKAKERVRERVRETSLQDTWWDVVYDSAKDAAKLLGIEFATRVAHTVGGKAYNEPQLYFALSYSQGDGACFSGVWTATSGDKIEERVKGEFPQNERLHEVARAFDGVLESFDDGTNLWAKVEHRGQGEHSGCMYLDSAERSRDGDVFSVGAENEARIQSAFRKFADWIFAQLKSEAEYLTSDEYLDELLGDDDQKYHADGSEYRNREA